jgi:hypothetical protein
LTRFSARGGCRLNVVSFLALGVVLSRGASSQSRVSRTGDLLGGGVWS